GWTDQAVGSTHAGHHVAGAAAELFDELGSPLRVAAGNLRWRLPAGRRGARREEQDPHDDGGEQGTAPHHPGLPAAASTPAVAPSARLASASAARSHPTNIHDAAPRYTTPAGIHMISPATCWSARAAAAPALAA